jgi:transcriptional regulator with XRE-family HTH domain
MPQKSLFADLIAAHPCLAEELKAVDVAADLTLLLHGTGISREDLARRLGWSDDFLSQFLSGQDNMSIQAITRVARALGYTFDLVFRKTDEPSALAASDEVRAKLAERQITQADVATAVDWARAQTPIN